MEFYMAPMEGLTGYIVRNAYHRHFHNIDKYFTPFIPAAKRMNSKILRDIDPENNKGITLVPQLMTNNAEEVLFMHKQLAEYGYDEININLGCPSGTVASKKRGSGLLAYPDELDYFLDELFSQANFPISIKTRIGYSSEKEWETLAGIYAKYPIHELIIHPRTRQDLYKFPVHPDAFAHAVENIPLSLCYNGDIIDVSSYEKVCNQFPSINKIMIGRGLFRNPGLISSIKREPAPDKETLRSYHDEILEGYLAIFSGEKDALFRMKEHWFYLGNAFENADKYCKVIRKTSKMTEYCQAVNGIFANCPLK